MKTKHYFDLDGTLWETNAKTWIIDKLYPVNPILKINSHEYNTTINGLYIKDNNRIYYNGIEGWLSNELLTKIKQKKPLELDRIGISLREFNDMNFLNNKLHTVNYNLDYLKANNITNISILTARGNKEAHKQLLDKLETELLNYNITIDDIIFVNDIEEYKYKNNGDSALLKLIKLIQTIIGFEIHENKFVPLMCDDADIVYFYDDNDKNINMCNDINKVIIKYYNNSDKTIQNRIKNKVFNKKLITNLVTTNKVNPYITEEINIDFTV